MAGLLSRRGSHRSITRGGEAHQQSASAAPRFGAAATIKYRILSLCVKRFWAMQKMWCFQRQDRLDNRCHVLSFWQCPCPCQAVESGNVVVNRRVLLLARGNTTARR
jgi:hypothetical protein